MQKGIEKNRTDHFDSCCLPVYTHVALTKAFDRKSQGLDSISPLGSDIDYGLTEDEVLGYGLDKLSAGSFVLFLLKACSCPES